MQNQVLYAPFVKASDKVKKDVVDLSLADFQPKRFALNYDPPMISKYSYINVKLYSCSTWIFGAIYWKTISPQDEIKKAYREEYREGVHIIFTEEAPFVLY